RQSLVSVSLAPGTQWSQNPMLSLPAAWAPRTKGAPRAANAALRNKLRRVRAVDVITFSFCASLPPCANPSRYPGRLSAVKSGFRGFGQLIDGVGQQPVLDLGDADVAEVVDQISPRVVEPADARDERDNAADFQPIDVHPPAADQ